jgi:hypothetical protein
MSLVPNQQMVVTITIEQLSSIVEDASKKGALRALEEKEHKELQSSLLSKDFLSIKEVGQLFSISRVTVDRWCQQKKLKKIYINGVPRFDTKELKKLLKAA